MRGPRSTTMQPKEATCGLNPTETWRSRTRIGEPINPSRMQRADSRTATAAISTLDWERGEFVRATRQRRLRAKESRSAHLRLLLRLRHLPRLRHFLLPRLLLPRPRLRPSQPSVQPSCSERRIHTRSILPSGATNSTRTLTIVRITFQWDPPGSSEPARNHPILRIQIATRRRILCSAITFLPRLLLLPTLLRHRLRHRRHFHLPALRHPRLQRLRNLRLTLLPKVARKLEPESTFVSFRTATFARPSRPTSTTLQTKKQLSHLAPQRVRISFTETIKDNTES